MVKGGGKSSASAGTRKKHAKKAVGAPPADDPLPKEKKPKKKEKGQNKKEPRIKIYIPPLKPAPVQPDPLETTGLVHSLPPDLLIVLRSFSKKAQVTKVRALEELQSGWVDKYQAEGEDGPLVHVLVAMLPVWLHHVSALFVHPSRRVRLLASGLHTSLLQIPPVREQILFFLRETVPSSQIESVLGTWCMAAHDVDKSVSSVALKSWTGAIVLDEAHDQNGFLVLHDRFLPPIVTFIQRAILDPSGLYLYLNPTPPAIAPTPPKKVPGRPPPRKDDPGQNTRSKAEELEESEQDRKARLRISAFGAIKQIVGIVHRNPSENVTLFFQNPAVWSSLHYAEQCPFIEMESFGFCQPNVRKAAWSLVQTLLHTCKEGELEPLLPMLSSGILRSAWVEPDTTVHSAMWQPLLIFLKKYPSAWELQRVQEYKKNEAAENSDSDESGVGAEERSRETTMVLSADNGPSIAYQEFLQFLELGCSGSPLQGYPTVVIILSTIPSSIFSSSLSPAPLVDLFTSFWAVVDGRALNSLHRSATSAAFLSALFECMVFLIKRLRSDINNHGVLLFGFSPTTPDIQEEANRLVREQISRVWEELVGKTLKVEQRAAARLMGQTLASLHEIGEDLFSAAWETLSLAIMGATESSPSLVSVFLKAFQDRFKNTTGPRDAAASLKADILDTSMTKCEQSLKIMKTEGIAVTDSISLLIDLLEQFREGLFFDTGYSDRIDRMMAHDAYHLLGASPSLLLTYLSHRDNEGHCLRAWHALLIGVSQHPVIAEKQVAPLLDAAQRGALPPYLTPSVGEIDALVRNLLDDALVGPSGSSHLTFVRQILQTPDYFLSATGYASSLQSVMSSFTYQVDLAFSDSNISLLTFDPSLDLVTSVFQHPPRTLPTVILDTLFPDVFMLGYLLPQCYDLQEHPTFNTARNLWVQWTEASSGDRRADVYARIKIRLRDTLCNTQVRPLPQDILRMLSQTSPDLAFILPTDIFPTPEEISQMLDSLSPDVADSSLGVMEPLVPPGSASTDYRAVTQLYDGRGFSAYVRVVDTLLTSFAEDRQIAKQNPWAWRHFLALLIYAQDFQRVPSAQSPVFEAKALSVRLNDMISKIQQVMTYILTSLADDGWRRDGLTAILDNNSTENLSALSRFLVEVVKESSNLDTTRDSRILRHVLSHIFHDVEKDEADQWILLARRMEKTAPQTSMSIVSAVAEFAPEPPRLDRYRNELAAALLGIPASKANTEGLFALRKLAASAPNADSEVVFLSQLRAVNVVKACQQWVASDEDIDEDVESVMTLIFLHLAPILQNVPGAHWDLIYDVVENNIENSPITDDAALVALARTLRLIILIQDLASTNKALREDWQKRRMPILTTVRDLATAAFDELGVSIPRSICRGLVLAIMRDLPASLIDQDTLPKMCHLIMDASADVQRRAYQVLHNAARRRTEYLVIEAGVDAEAAVKTDLPPELLAILQRAVDIGPVNETGQEEQGIFGYLLGWMLVFDLFQDASLKVRSSYIEQLRNLDIIATHFMPNLLVLLCLDRGPLKAFKLDVWAVDEFYIEFFETGSSFSLPLLAAHLYYRALLTVPSLIHTWVLDCKDRQLSSSITNYTTQYFSPVLIRTELAHVKSAESTALLVDENLSIKVAPSVNEVVASYLVDEHQLEIKLKIPPDWPLHRIEIKDLKRVGVDENRWRAWILAVQQTIWSHNGRIVDGLGLFKKNVTLHFEGQVECAICYSIISVMDGSLPRKPCKTCKNRFHAGCLYKWFNSSHSSSCPLCRSDIL